MVLATNLDSGFYNLAPTYPSGFNAALSFVTPFTHRTNISYAELLMELYKWLREQHLPELDKVLDEWKKQYQIDFNGLKQDIINTKNNWQELFDEFIQNITNEIAILNDEAISSLLKDLNSLTHKELAKHESYINVLSYGLVGDGVTDNTEKLQYMIEENGVGAKYYVPHGEFLVNGNVYLRKEYANDIGFIGNGTSSMFRKKSGSTNASVFVPLAGTNTGYSSGVLNMSFESVSFRGDFTTNTAICAVAGNRPGNISFTNCDFIEAVISGHAVDAMGVDGLTFDNCRFYGAKPPAGREYTEAIQIDASLRSGASFIIPDGEYFDGIGARNIRVERCEFLPITVAGVKYPAPTPLGSHTWVDGKPHRNVVFNDNIVDDVVDSTSGGGFPGVLHFYGVLGVTVKRNKYKNSNSPFVRVVRGTQSYTPESSDMVTPISGTSNFPVNMEDMYVEDNEFENITHPTAQIIWIYGNATDRVKNINVRNNKFINCMKNTRVNMIQVTYGDDNIEISGNKAESCDGVLAYSANCETLVFDNNKTDGGMFEPARFDNMRDVYVRNNVFGEHTAQFLIRGYRVASLSNNTVHSSGEWSALRLENGTSTPELAQVNSNVVRHIGSEPWSANPGIFITEGVKRGVAVGNIGDNFTIPIYAPDSVEKFANIGTV